MATEAQRLAQEIVDTRERLGHEVDLLVDRVDPRRVAAREAVKARSLARAHPGAAALLAAGVGALVVTWLVRRFR